MAEEAKEATGSMGDDTPLLYYQIIIDQLHIILDRTSAKLLTHQ